MDTKKLEYYTAEDYYALPEGTHAELIDGILYYPPYGQAAPARRHQGLVMELSYAVKSYIEAKKGSCRIYPAPFDVRLDENDDSVVQPDISVICDPSKLTDRGCTGAPDWIIEIVSPGNAAYDYITKLKKYLAAGVREYWIVDPDTDSVTVYDLTSEKLVPEQFGFKDTVKSLTFDDLSIDLAKLTASL
ncbi:MAG TPA: Uma2 family endonuclease [Lachnospiraceae bacterium]|nr:Uma2 family endonuclease [Lachnospiraceae bacterium]